MKILCCTRCQRQSLISTGAFWSCHTCGYAITQAALSAESALKPDRSRPLSEGRGCLNSKP